MPEVQTKKKGCRYVRFPDGKVGQRRTDRTYSHVVVALVHPHLYVKDPNTGLSSKQFSDSVEWVALHWCGRFDLAQKQMAVYDASYRTLLHIEDIRIVAVEPEE